MRDGGGGHSPICPWLCYPSGPHTPFHGWLLICTDSVRMLCIVGGLLVVSLTLLLISRATLVGGQHARFVALALFALSAIGSEAVHAGDYPSYRLALNFLGVVLGLYGLAAFRRENPATERAPVGPVTNAS